MTAPRRPLRTSPLGSSASLSRPDECRIELLREDLIALTDELVEELTRYPRLQVIGASRGTVHRALSTMRFD